MNGHEVGNVVITHPSHQGPRLFCGSGVYTHAICVSVDPFVLVSEHGDMLWRTVQPEEVLSLCKADAGIVAVGLKRLASS